GWQKQTPHEDSVPTAPRLEPVEDEGGNPDTNGPEERPRVELRTVQAVVERAVRETVREPVVLMGASRTGSGVHARGQFAAFPCPDEGERGIGWPLARGTESLVKAVNSRLPEDVQVVAAEVAAPDFNPIQGAVSKAYSYTIWNAPDRPLWE